MRYGACFFHQNNDGSFGQSKNTRFLSFIYLFLFVSLLFLIGCDIEENTHLDDIGERNQCISSNSIPDWVVEAEKRIPSSILAIVKPSVNKDDVIIHAQKRTLKYANKTLYRLVVFNSLTGDAYKTAVDNKGKIVDYKVESKNNILAAQSINGLLTNELSHHVNMVKSDNELVEVQIWYKNSPPFRRPKKSSKDIKAQLSVLSKQNENQLYIDRFSLINRLKSLGVVITYQAKRAPFIEALVSKNKIVNQLSWDKEITLISLSHRKMGRFPLSFNSSQDLGIGLFHSSGFDGSGEKVGIIEACRECGIWFDNQVLSFGSVIKKKNYISCNSDNDCAALTPEPFLEGPRCISGYCYGFHPTIVTGMIGMTVSTIPDAGAHGATIVHANDDSVSHSALLDWLAQQNTYVVNESWGGTSTDWHAHDYFVRNSYMTILRASGNSGYNSVVNCSSFNIICVGGYDMGYTPGMWWDGFMWIEGPWSGTSTKNLPDCEGGSPGTGCDRELPHITGSGYGCTSATINSSDTDGLIEMYWQSSTSSYQPLKGTSLATPAISGLVALMMAKESFLTFWPEAIRAILMVSAIHDIDRPVPGKAFSNYQAPDENDGAGVPVVDQMFGVMNGTTGNYQTLDLEPSDFDASNKKELASISVNAGEKIRAVISWNTCPNGYGYGPVSPPLPGVSADFDLTIKNPGGGVEMTASSYDGGYEILEITAPTSGTYKIEISYYTWENCYGQKQEYVGFAYNVGTWP